MHLFKLVHITLTMTSIHQEEAQYTFNIQRQNLTISHHLYCQMNYVLMTADISHANPLPREVKTQHQWLYRPTWDRIQQHRQCDKALAFECLWADLCSGTAAISLISKSECEVHADPDNHFLFDEIKQFHTRSLTRGNSLSHSHTQHLLQTLFRY